MIDRARIVLDALEKGEREGGAAQKALIDDLPLFSAVPVQSAPVKTAPSVLKKSSPGFILTS